MHIGEKIKKVRTEKGLNQTELANLINSKQFVVSRIERTGIATTTSLKKIAEALDCDLEIDLKEKG